MVPDLVGLFDAKVANAATRQRNMNIQSPHVDLYSAFYKLKLCTIEYMWVIFSNFWQILVSNYPNYVRRYRKCLSKNCWVCPCFAKAVTCICFGQERFAQGHFVLSHRMGCGPFFGLWSLWSQIANILQHIFWCSCSCLWPGPIVEPSPNNLTPEFGAMEILSGLLTFGHCFQGPLAALWLFEILVSLKQWHFQWSILCQLPIFANVGAFSIRTALLWYIAATEQRWRLPLSYVWRQCGSSLERVGYLFN